MEDILWNIPEQKTGNLALVGGNSQNFASVIKCADYLASLPLKTVQTVLPDSLKGKIPPVPDVIFTTATLSGSFDKSPALNAAMEAADLTLLIGDLSKNSATTIAISEAIKNTEKPVVLARDSLDCIAEEAGAIMDRENFTIIATTSQLQKLLRALYYPKMLLLSSPMQAIKEVLHKFTLTYPCTIMTFHEGQIITAKNGEIETVALSKSDYSLLTLWGYELPAKIAALELWNPQQELACIQTAILTTASFAKHWYALLALLCS